MSISLNECNVFADDVPDADLPQNIVDKLVELFKLVGFSQDQAESFVSKLLNYKSNTQKDKLQADLDQIFVMVDEVGTSVRKNVISFNQQLAVADQILQDNLQQREKKQLQLLGMELQDGDSAEAHGDKDDDDDDDDHNSP